jgi:hypothetical protein
VPCQIEESAQSSTFTWWGSGGLTVLVDHAGDHASRVDPQQYRYGQPLGELFDGGAVSAFGKHGRVDVGCHCLNSLMALLSSVSAPARRAAASGEAGGEIWWTACRARPMEQPSLGAVVQVTLEPASGLVRGFVEADPRYRYLGLAWVVRRRVRLP